MEQLGLIGNKVRLVVDDKALAVLSDSKLKTVSSAIYQGGCKKTKSILNVKVPRGYDQQKLHKKPELLVSATAKEMGISADEVVGMITAANLKQFSLVTEKKGKMTVNAIVTAGCQFTESAGEPIKEDRKGGTINTIVLLDGNPSESCLVGALLTATEAKTAALNDLDLRSNYSGDLATGTITDSTVIASTGRGEKLRYAGPSSKLGSLVGYCVREAVKETIMRHDNLSPERSIIKRFEERGLPMEKMVSELSKVSISGSRQEEWKAKIKQAIKKDIFFSSFLMATSKLDEEIKKGLIPKEFGKVDAVGKEFRNILRLKKNAGNPTPRISLEEINSVDLPPLLKRVLIGLIESSTRERKN